MPIWNVHPKEMEVVQEDKAGMMAAMQKEIADYLQRARKLLSDEDFQDRAHVIEKQIERLTKFDEIRFAASAYKIKHEYSSLLTDSEINDRRSRHQSIDRPLIHPCEEQLYFITPGRLWIDAAWWRMQTVRAELNLDWNGNTKSEAMVKSIKGFFGF